jgi:hypothetical protein
MSFLEWTGNPFVDTGLCVVIARAKSLGKQVTTIDDLTPEVFQDVVGNGSWFIVLPNFKTKKRSV